MIDIGINLTDKSFANDLDSVLKAASAVGVRALIITGTSEQGSEQAQKLVDSRPESLFFTCGVHPHHAKEWNHNSFKQLESLAAHPKAVAIGETGLDFNRDFSPRPQQIAAFEQQIELAAETAMPLFLHERDAFDSQYAILKANRDHFSNAVIHCFTGSRKALYAYLDLDLYIGITGWVCDERRGQSLQQLLKDIPSDRLMLETDAPYLIPRDLQPKPKSRRNEPKYLPHIAEQVALLRNEDPEELKRQTQLNSERFFNIQLQAVNQPADEQP